MNAMDTNANLLSPNMILNSALAEFGSLMRAAETAHFLFGCCE